MASLEVFILVMAVVTLLAFQLQQFAKAATPIQAETKYPCAFIDTINITGRIRYQNNGIHNSHHYDGSSSSNNSNNNNNNKNNSNNNKSDTKNINWTTEATPTATAMNTAMTMTIPMPKMMMRNFNVTTISSPDFGYKNAWLEVHRELVAIYDFVIENGVRVPVARHLRACVCKLKPCIRFCCPAGHYYDVTNSTCSMEVHEVINATMKQNLMLVRNRNGIASHQQLTEERFNIHIGLPCERMRAVLTDQKGLINWTLYENGTIAYKHHLFTRHYCYSPYRAKNETWIWQPLACSIEKLPFLLGVREWTYVICLILSAICMAIIFLVYLACTELRNTFYGVAIKAFTLCLIIGYSLMIHLMVTDPTKMSKTACTLIPCVILLYLLLSFYIMTFISFNFYLNFHGVILTKLMFWLIFFPIVSLAVAWSLFVAYANHGGKPVLGGETCWFDPRNWAIMIYFYGPIFMAFAFGIFFYILTLIRITDRQENEMKNFTGTLEENRFSSFWKFFTYTFLTWLVCVISFVINYYRGERTYVNYVVCVVMALHGFGSLYALIGKNEQIQNFLRRIENDIDDDDEEVCESALPMTPLERD